VSEPHRALVLPSTQDVLRDELELGARPGAGHGDQTVPRGAAVAAVGNYRLRFKFFAVPKSVRLSIRQACRRAVELNEFEEIFRDSEMKVLLDWDFVKKSGASVNEIYTRSADSLAQLYTVWYSTPSGLNGGWPDSEDTPLRIGETLKTFPTWPAARRERVNYFRTQFEQSEHPVQLTLPAYAPNDRDVILLDGTHRAVAAHIVGKEVRLIIFALHGPCDSRALPDLAHYSA
jgi:hypothetical protein